MTQIYFSDYTSEPFDFTIEDAMDAQESIDDLCSEISSHSEFFEPYIEYSDDGTYASVGIKPCVDTGFSNDDTPLEYAVHILNRDDYFYPYNEISWELLEEYAHEQNMYDPYDYIDMIDNMENEIIKELNYIAKIFGM